MNAKIFKELAIDLSEVDIANAFCQLDGEQQAAFFAEVASIMNSWPIAHEKTQFGCDWQISEISSNINSEIRNGQAAATWLKKVVEGLEVES